MDIKTMTTKRMLGILAVSLILSVSGCNSDILDPTQVGRYKPTPKVGLILDTIGVADEPSPTYDGAEDPRPEDLQPYESDYVFSAGDIVQISIFELYNEGQDYVSQFIVSESGRLSIPVVGTIMAAGLTETELEREISSILSPNILRDPSVTVTLLNSERRFFSVVGQGVAQSARFQMPRHPIRVTDAMALAGGIGDFNVSYVYISRDVKAEDYPDIQTPVETKPTETLAPARKSVEEQMLEMITPSERARRNSRMITTSEMSTRSRLLALAAPEGIDPLDVLADETEAVEPTQPAAPARPASRIEWVFEDGQWKAVEVDAPADSTDLKPEVLAPEQYGTERTTPQQPVRSDFGLADIGNTETVTRVIKIPVDRLLAGDPRYNIVIRPGDRITVPRDLVGEFYVAGNVNAPGAYPITGRPITLKQAIPIAGELNQIAWPQKVEVIRRLGKNEAGVMQEEVVLVDYKKICDFEQPDFYIKQHDLIRVGTHGTARWLAVLRNAFRATYGFGLIYDRNFAYDDFGDNPLNFPF